MSVRCLALDKNSDSIVHLQAPMLLPRRFDKEPIPGMMTHQLKRSHQLLLFTFLSLCLDSTRAASLNLVPASPSLNASQNHPHAYHCNSLPSWTGGGPSSPTYKIQDCNQAIRMFEQDVTRHPGQAQWLSLGFPQPVSGYGNPVWTPTRYTSGELLMRHYMAPSCDDTSRLTWGGIQVHAC